MSILDSEEYVEALVYLKDRVDPENVAAATRMKTAVASTPYRIKMEVRKGVVEALQDQAEKTQINLLNYIEHEKNQGNVVEYESYYITNIVYVKATKKVIENISYFPEVEKICKNKFIKLDESVLNNTDEKQVCKDKDREQVHGDKDEEQMHGDKDEGEVEWNIERIGADLVWEELDINGTGAVVGLIDTGVAWEHPALKEKWRGYDSATDTINPEGNWYDAVSGEDMPYDILESSHGTSVLGTILGQEPDGSNKIGVAPGARWIAAKAFSADGGFENDLIAAGQWMLAPGGDPTQAPDVINNSWGGDTGEDEWFRDIVRAWRAAEIVPVFSAGNQAQGEPKPKPGSVTNPGNYPESFAVAATDKDDMRASFSKLGPSPYDKDLIKPEIAAPGVDIRSSVSGGYKSDLKGTSMAASHITGTVALLASADSSLKASEIEKIIKDTAIGLTDDEYLNSPNCGYGYGLVNACDAVSMAISGTGIISGRVLVEGEDLENPVIIHQQEVREAYINADIEIIANISDDISVPEAELLVKVEGKSDWMSVPMQRILGDHKDGTYKAVITSDMLEEPGIIYKIRAADYGVNVVVTEDYKIDIIFGIIPGEYETDFETEPVGWILTGDWEWGEPQEGIGPAPYQGTKLIGTKLDGVYSYDSDSYLITPPIDLRNSDIPSATLRFFQWYKTPEKYDYDHDKGQVYLSDDGGENWMPVGPEYLGDGREWHEALVNLEEYIGSPNPIHIAFRFITDDAWTEDGWYIDYVRLVGEDNEPPAAPTGLIAENTLAGIRLSWNPSSEVDCKGYKVYRSEVPGEQYVEIGNESLISFIDETAEAGNTYYYVITAVDLAGNESEYSEEVSETAPHVVRIFKTNFEDDNGVFITGLTQEGRWYNNYWEWGIPISGPNAALTGTKVWATNLAGNYDEYSRGYIESPSMIVPENVTAALFFDHWIDSESTTFDYGYVAISEDDGVTWVKVTENIGGHIKKWKNREINLADYSGKTIKIRFCFSSDGAHHYEGWYIDNVLVSGVDTIAINGISIAEPVVISSETSRESKKNKLPREESIEIPKFNFRKNKTNDYEIVADYLVGKKTSGGIPADAVVTVLETGKSVKTDPATGKFFIWHVANEEGENWTLIVEAYGYYSQEAQVHLERDGEIDETIFLETKPRGTIKGKVFDSYYKMPVVNAEIKVKEDPKISPVVTDEEGNFTLEGILEGTYTLKIKADWFYDRGKTEVTVVGNQIKEIEIPLKRSVSYVDEISYDQDLANNSVVMTNEGDGAAVKFTPPQYGKVEGANIYFSSEFPLPGGDEIGIVIFDTDENGDPVEMIGEPEIANINRGGWNFIDLSEYEFITNRDFFIATVQTQHGMFSPAVGITDSPYPSNWIRSYLHKNNGGTFIRIMDDSIRGTLMIRAKMGYSASIPEITNLGEITYINQDRITVEGKVADDGKVNLYVNGEKVQTMETVDKAFIVELDLEEDENIIMATSELKGIETEPSNPVKVFKDKVSPILEVVQPLDGEIVHLGEIYVSGNVIEEHLDKLLINGKEAVVDEEGNYSGLVELSEGENVIIIKAIDLAGNTTTVTRKVTLAYEDLSKYELEIEKSDEYEIEETESSLVLTINQTVTGFKHFGAMVRSRTGENLGQLTVVFTHLRNNMQHGLNSIQADYDADMISARAGFNVEPGDILKIYLVDELTNETDRNPIILK